MPGGDDVEKAAQAAQNAAESAADHAEAKADDAVNAAEAAAAKAEDKVQDEAKAVEDAAAKAEDKVQDEAKAAEDAAAKAEDKVQDEAKAAEDAAAKAEDKVQDEAKAAEDAAAKAEDKVQDEAKAAEDAAAKAEDKALDEVKALQDAAAKAETKALDEAKAVEDAAAQAEAKAEAAVKAAAGQAQAAVKAAEAGATRAADAAANMANSALGAAAAAAALGGRAAPVADDAKGAARDRDTKLTLRMGDEQFNLINLTASEGLSQPFLITIDVLSELGAFDLMPHLGSEAIVENLRDGEHMRYFHGVVTDGHLVGEAVTGTQLWSEGAHHYRLTLRPKAYFHSHGRDFRIYQDMSVLTIIKDVLERDTIDYEDKQQDNAGATRSLKYCVQFGESDMAFVYRLMEEHGIYYFYRHDKDKHVMVLCDAPGSHGKLATPDLRYHPYAASIANFGSAARGGAVQTISEWQEYLSTGAEKIATLRDYDFIRPALQVEGVKQGDPEHTDDAVEVYNWSGRFYQNADGVNLAKFLLESRRAQRQRYEGSTAYSAMQPGYTFTQNSHPISRFNAEFLVIAMHTVLSAEVHRSGTTGGGTEVQFTAIPAKTAYRAPLVTPRPVAQGPETAVVVGPSGEEIYVDQYARIKVQFHWDRYGKNDDKSSCWVRVSQTGGLGNMVIPRVGMEVLIDFINGNPDRPIVVGRLYNAANMPVYALPAHKTKAVWRSKTYQRTDSQKYEVAQPEKIEEQNPAANELRFEDKTGEEELYIHAEKDLNTRVRHDETHFVAKDQTIKVWNNQITEVHKDRTEEVWGDEKITLHQNRTEDVTADETVTIQGNRKVTISGTETLKVTGDIKVDSDGNIAITAQKKITLTCGMSTIEMSPTAIKINGVEVEANGQASAKLTAMGQVTVQATGITTIQGAMVKIN